MFFKTKRAWQRARRTYVRQRMVYRRCTRPDVRIAPTETRDELIERARAILEFAAYKRRYQPYRADRYEQRRELREVAILRAAAMARPRVDPTGRAFYACARDGARHALLYGPFATQMAALRALPLARRAALDRYPEAAFVAFGTASLPRADACPGILNPHLSPIPEFA